MKLYRIILPTLMFAGSMPAIAWAQTNVSESPRLIEEIARLPLAFEKQGDASRDRFVARGQGYSIGLDGGKVVIGVVAKDRTKHAVSLEFAGAQPGRAIPGPELPGKVNYIHGNDPRNWQIGLATYERVTYPNAYPGIDVVYYGNGKQLEFDLIVKPGADPEAIRLKVGGAGRLFIDGTGALDLGTVRVDLPRIYQETNGAKKSVPGHYAIVGADEVAFRIDPWDRTHPLVIDPAIVYSTLLGGSTGTSQAQGIALDSGKNMYVAGYTCSADFPVVNAYQSAVKTVCASSNGFVTEINAAGTALLYSTYLGGSASDQFQGIAVDSTGAAWVAGYTSSTDFPVIGAVQPKSGGGTDAVVVKLNPSGVPVFSTYLGGTSTDEATGVAVDTSKNAYVTGYSSLAFPTTPGVFQSSNNGSQDVFVAKFSTTGSELYATLLGGTGSDMGFAVAADTGGNAYVTGSTTSATIPNAPAGGAQPANAGGGDAFVAKVDPTGKGLVYFTFLGGTAIDQGSAIAVDTTGDAYVGGYTASIGLATTGVSPGGGTDGFVAELNPAGTKFTYVTYLGGSRNDQVNALAIDGLGNVYAAGQTESNNFPVKSAVEPSMPGNGGSATNGFTLFQTLNSGGLWTALDTNIPGAVFDVSADPASFGTIVVTTEQGIFRTTNGGGSWTRELSGLFAAGVLSRSPVASNTIYAAETTGSIPTIYLSADGGLSWTAKGTVIEPIYAPNFVQQGGIIADPLTAGTVYAFSLAGAYISSAVQKSTDSGQTWSPASTGLPADTLLGSMVAGADGSLYVSLFNSGGVYKSTNHGASWVAINSGLPANPTLFQHSITVSAANPMVLYLATSAQIYKTTNGGTSWSPVSLITGYKGNPGGGLSVAVSPQNSSIVYVWDAYTYMSADGGTTWTYAGLPGISVDPFAFDPLNSAHVFAVAGAISSGFVAKLNSSGAALTWSTYLGVTGATQAFGVATDGTGDAFVTGLTGGASEIFTTTASALESSLPNTGAFVMRISDATPSCTYTVSPAAQTITGGGQFAWYSLLAPSGCAWTASSDESWASTLSGPSGTGTLIVSVQAATNSTGASRTAHLTIGGQTVTLTQADSSCTYSISPSSFSVPAAGGPVSVEVITEPGCPWTLTNSSEAITIKAGASGTGNGAIALTVSPNAGSSSRAISLPVGGTSISIVQASSTQLFQTIAFGPLSNQALGSIPPALGATASSGLAVTFNSATASICTVSGTTVTLLKTGVCSIVASQAGNAGFIAATPVTQTFTVGVGSPQTIKFDAIPNQILGISPFVIAAQASSLLPVKFVSTTTTVCRMADDLVTLLTAGTCSITASQPGNAGNSAATSVTQSFTVSVAKPSGSFTAGPGSPLAVGNSPYSVAVGDFNRDGIPDLATANYGANSVTVLLGNGSGGFTPALGSPVAVGEYPSSVVVGDFNGDGNLDLAVTNYGSNDVTVLLGNGKGGFAPAAGSRFAVGTGPNSVALGDFNGDGIQDLAVANGLSNDVTVLLGNGAGGFTPAAGSPFSVAANPGYLAVGDFNNDGILDLAVPNQAVGVAPGTVTVLLGDGSGGFAPAAGSPLSVGTAPNSVAVGDFNGDGSQDLAVPNLFAGTVTVLLGNGKGAFTPAPGSPIALGTGPLFLVVGDFNGDGIQDLATADFNTNNVIVLLGNGKGEFAPTPGSPFAVGNGARSMVVGDFNRDGIEDLAVANSGNFDFFPSFYTIPGNNVTVLLGALVGSKAQTITFGTPGSVTYGVGPFMIGATSASGLAVSFASTAPGVCAVAGTTVTITGAGTCSITASQAGNATYAAAATVMQSFTVNPASQTVTFGALSNKILGAAPFALSATASSGLAVTFSSNSTAICTVSGATVTLLTDGTCSITANQDGNSNYLAATAVTRTFTVAGKAQTITFGALVTRTLGAAPFALSATASSGLAVTFASNSTAVCTVSGVTVTLLTDGTCSITATQTGNTTWAAATVVTQIFTVGGKAQTITFAALANRTLGAAPFAVSATASSGLAVTFVSNSTAVCTVSGVTATLLTDGTCSITATQDGNSTWAAAPAVTQIFTVAGKAQTITFGTLSNQTLGAVPFAVSATATSGLAVTFISNSTAVCTVSGVTITLLTDGTCSITATQDGDTTWAAAPAVTQTFTVAGKAQTITFAALGNQNLFETSSFAVSATASSGLAVTFISNSTGVCTVSGTTVTLAAVGTCSITATQDGNSTWAAAPPVTRTFTVSI